MCVHRIYCFSRGNDEVGMLVKKESVFLIAIQCESKWQQEGGFYYHNVME